MSEQQTKRVRILVVIDPNGKWEAGGSHSWDDERAIGDMNDMCGDLGEPPWAYHWIEADVPVPREVHPDAIEGELQP